MSKHVSTKTVFAAAVRIQEQNPGMHGLQALREANDLAAKRDERIDAGDRRHGRKER